MIGRTAADGHADQQGRHGPAGEEGEFRVVPAAEGAGDPEFGLHVRRVILENAIKRRSGFIEIQFVQTGLTKDKKKRNILRRQSYSIAE